MSTHSDTGKILSKRVRGHHGRQQVEYQVQEHTIPHKTWMTASDLSANLIAALERILSPQEPLEHSNQAVTITNLRNSPLLRLLVEQRWQILDLMTQAVAYEHTHISDNSTDVWPPVTDEGIPVADWTYAPDTNPSRRRTWVFRLDTISSRADQLRLSPVSATAGPPYYLEKASRHWSPTTWHQVPSHHSLAPE